jgi:hypothetical protein
VRSFPASVILAAVLAACGDGNDDGDTDAGVGDDVCLDAGTLSSLSEHAEQLRASAAYLSGHPGAAEAVGFFDFPALAVKRLGVYAGPLVMVCSEPHVYEEFCEEDGLCSQIECTGEGASWLMHFWLQGPVSGEVDYESATIDTAWADGDDGIEFTMASSAGAWSLTGSGAMGPETMTVEETYPDLLASAPVVVMMANTAAGGHEGSITVGGEVVATTDAQSGDFVSADRCSSSNE